MRQEAHFLPLPQTSLNLLPWELGTSPVPESDEVRTARAGMTTHNHPGLPLAFDLAVRWPAAPSWGGCPCHPWLANLSCRAHVIPACQILSKDSSKCNPVVLAGATLPQGALGNIWRHLWS